MFKKVIIILILTILILTYICLRYINCTLLMGGESESYFKLPHEQKYKNELACVLDYSKIQ